MSQYIPAPREAALHGWNPVSVYKQTLGKILSPKKTPPVPVAPAPPTIEDTQGRAQDEGDRLRRRRGRASQVLSDSSAAAPMTASKVLLGA